MPIYGSIVAGIPFFKTLNESGISLSEL